MPDKNTVEKYFRELVEETLRKENGEIEKFLRHNALGPFTDCYHHWHQMYREGRFMGIWCKICDEKIMYNELEKEE